MLIIVMAQVLAAWVVAGLLITGIGVLIRRLWKLRSRGLDDYLIDFWMGWAALLALLQVWHLGWRIGWQLWVPVAVMGGIGWAIQWRGAVRVDGLTARQDRAGTEPGRSVNSVQRGEQRPGRGFWVVWGLLGVGMANLAVGPPWHYDTGLYHLSAIQWAEAYRAVPGLGNLHYRLAYNSSHFLYGALWHAIAGEQGFHFVNGLLLLAYLGLAPAGGLPGLADGSGRKAARLVLGPDAAGCCADDGPDQREQPILRSPCLPARSHHRGADVGLSDDLPDQDQTRAIGVLVMSSFCSGYWAPLG